MKGDIIGMKNLFDGNEKEIRKPKNILGVTISNSEKMHKSSYQVRKNRRLYNTVCRLFGEVRIKNYWKDEDPTLNMKILDRLYILWMEKRDETQGKLVFLTQEKNSRN